jgi:hypothetical protein
MNSTEFEIKPYNLGSPLAMMPLMSTAAVTIIGIFGLTVSKNIDIWVMAIFGPMILAFPLQLAHFLSDKVKFNADCVIQASIFRFKKLKIEDIKTFGVYQQRRYNTMRSPIDPEKAGEDRFPFLTHSIFLSVSEKFDLSSLFPKKNIRLQFRRVEYEKIRQWMKKASAPRH